MAEPPRIGQYQHKPATALVPGPDGQVRHARVRRRFPFMGLVPLAFGALVPLLCAGFSLLLRSLRATPTQLGATRQPAPSWENVIFGFGFAELMIAWAVVGFLLWRVLWNQRMPLEAQRQGVAGVLGSLMRTGAVVGPFLAILYLPIAVWGLATREMPGVPVLMRPFMAILAAPFITVSALVNPAVLLTTVLTGLILGVLTAPVVAVLWQRHPEEPILK